jgi:alginate O-acetyltransferase complex protein AlgI
MLFNTLNFGWFLIVVFFLYWFVAGKKLGLQNLLLLVSSYFFYACWDYRFLFLLIFSTLLDYTTGIKIREATTSTQTKVWFWLSICVNLGFLAVFKYFNFFTASFADALLTAGIKADFWTLNIILPVGISFYTFHGLSYVIDIYNNRIEPERNFVSYAVFVSFFPLLVAGPIERATHLLPQIITTRKFDYVKAVDGVRQILWGLFKKVVIADNCAEYADKIFDHSADYSGSTLVLGALFFAFQIYGDFSGYSDIAIGTAKLFGIELLRNFAFPYFSRDIAEFWRRWHISLSSWFKDYLYIPLGGSKRGMWMTIRNTLIIFVVSGFWHGANWTFIAWGALNAIYILPSVVLRTNRTHLNIVAQGRVLPTVKEALSVVITFALTVFAWIFFRAENLSHAMGYIAGIFSTSLISPPEMFPRMVLMLVAMFLLIEWSGRENQHALAKLALNWPRALRYTFYYALVLLIVVYGGSNKQFIYFQF